MSKQTDYEIAQEGVLEGLWQCGYRQVTGRALDGLAMTAWRYLDGEIRENAAKRKIRKEIRRLDRDLARPDAHKFGLQLQQVPA